MNNYIDFEFIGTYNGWTPEYTKKVFVEYERFLELRFVDPKISPSDQIDKFWHTHILNTKSYISYCYAKFKNIVHHDPADSLDQDARKIRLATTIIKYKEKFGNPIYNEIWGFYFSPNNLKSNSNNNLVLDSLVNKNLYLEKLKKTTDKEQLQIPKYDTSKDKGLDWIRIFIFYSFDDGYSKPNGIGKRYGFKAWKPNNLPLDREILDIKITSESNFDELKKFISEKTGHNKLAIDIYPHPEYAKLLESEIKKQEIKKSINISGMETFAFDYLYTGPDHLTEKIKYDNLIAKPFDKNYKFFIVELVEMTQNGFC